MNEDKDVIIRRGQRARSLLDDPIVKEIFSALETRQIAVWRDSPARDNEAREAIWSYVKALDLIRGHIEEMATNADAAQRQINEENELRRKAGEEREQIARDLGISVSDLIEE